MLIKNWKNPDYNSIWRLRNDRLNRIREDNKYYNTLVWHYKDKPVDFINDWGITYDPRRKKALLPFILFPRQVEYINWLKKNMEDQQNCLVEKSRDMGLTWLCIAFAVWLWLFHPGRAIGFGSSKVDKMDRLGDPDTIFEKIRWFIKYLPREFLPLDFNLEDHCPYLKILNPQNGSTITGEGGDQMGRGGRKSIYFKDESAFYERPVKVEAALSMNTNVQVDVSTYNGTGNPFYQKRMSGKIPVFTFHWKDDPRKDDAWYKKKCEEYSFDPVIIAQEIDINPAATMERVVIPHEWVAAAVNYNLPKSGMKISALDVADEGGDENCLIDRHGVVVEHVDAWKLGNTAQTTRRAYGLLKQRGVKLCNYDNVGVGAGVKAEFWSIAEREGKSAVIARGINSGGKVHPGNFAPGKPNSEMFMNLKAELWWELRERFRKTYENRNNIRRYKPYELISIPNDGQLIMELSQQTYKFKPNGKIIMESKEVLKKKGIRSPNRADALVMCFARISGVDYDLLTSI